MVRSGIWKSGRRNQQDRRLFQQFLRLHPPRHDIREFEMRVQGVHGKALWIRAFCTEFGRTLVCSACETPDPGTSDTRECKVFQDALGESRTCGRRATAEEVKRGDEADQETRLLDPSSSSTDPDPKRLKPTTMTDVENLAEQMDEDTSLRTLARLLHEILKPRKFYRRKNELQETYSHPW